MSLNLCYCILGLDQNLQNIPCLHTMSTNRNLYLCCTQFSACPCFILKIQQLEFWVVIISPYVVLWNQRVPQETPTYILSPLVYLIFLNKIFHYEVVPFSDCKSGNCFPSCVILCCLQAPYNKLCAAPSITDKLAHAYVFSAL